MKKLLQILLIIFIITTFSACTKESSEKTDLLNYIKRNQTFVVGINENSKPFAYKDEKTNTIKGFDADLIREISKYIFETDSIIKFEPVTPSNRILKLNSKEIDIIISTMTITSKRLRVVDFSNPYFMTGQALLVKKNSNIRTGKDLNYKKVGIVLGTTASNNMKYIAEHINIVGFKNYKEAFEELQRGNIDAISTDDVILEGIASSNKNYKVLPDKYSKEYYGIALRKDDDSQNLKNAINDALDALEKSGKIKELEIKYNVQYKR